ncbi:hypothetical protein N0O92_11385 [Alkalihalobacillus sp. MEB130]|uniref:hypothetical protein n=1 Tax=Alkalihalobacillus sp. MEB130 TaxID=2976704 RepID=UPI0028DFCA16|nr:hypothetical protein [Alkalihalobacillus sp. MEB130]MDT8860833.1 hypothetical protein [Alkalihalobacillus sp. MEB130]
MKELSIESKPESARITFYLLSVGAALMTLVTEGASFLFALLALALIAKSGVEQVHNKYLKFAGMVTYGIYFAWFAYKVVLWFYTNFIA